ncbi:MAG: type IX secretion system sortase PorU [Bacteroidota bacterium]|nr:type IX secretion system sortase PorU [Bacteroidota bacterium]
MIKKSLLLISLFFVTVIGFAQYHKFEDKVQWFDLNSSVLPCFEMSISDAEYKDIPIYYHTIDLFNEGDSFIPIFSVEEEREVASQEIVKILDEAPIKKNYFLQSGVNMASKQPVGFCKIVPFRKDTVTGKYFRLQAFSIEYIVEKSILSDSYKAKQYKENSVLSHGNWYKIAVDTCGIFKLTYSDFESMNFDVDNLSSSKIHIYGNGGGMLPQLISEPRYDDLEEIAIKVVDNGDGVFNNGDYVLFYAESSHVWKYKESTQKYHHKINYYSDQNHYFVTVGSADGKRIATLNSLSQTPNMEITQYDELYYHESDRKNLINTGREWYGEFFDLEKNYQFNLDITGNVSSEEIYFNSRYAAHSTLSTNFSIGLNSHNYLIAIPSIDDEPNTAYARTQSRSTLFTTGDNNLLVDITYNKSNNSSMGWLDYFELNYRRRLTLYGAQTSFRDKKSFGSGNISRFHFANTNAEIWEITDPCNIKKISTIAAGGEQRFVFETDVLREFVAFDGTEYYTPELVGTVANQNLHGFSATEYFIITHKDFIDEANRLADFHRNSSDLILKVVEIDKIFNEFSGGSQDITAIRDFLKVYYDKGNSETHLRYVLLFGDGSFDYKEKTEVNSNMIPTYETVNSLHPVSSYVTDDYYGYLDDNEGGMENNILDIGLGRLPVSTLEQAKHVVDKIVRYGSNSAEVQKNWRNVVCFIADDENQNAHIDYANRMATFIDTTYKNYNIDKIYLDAYQQESTPGGQRYPDAQNAVNDRVQKGALIINYTGHGGEVGLTEERVIGIPDIESWTNFDRLPVFITATCEFSRFDDSERVSAGELVLLNPKGGGIALLTTTRPTHGAPNFALNMSFYKHVFEKMDGELPRLGDLIRFTKIESGSTDNTRKFVLLGDPALQIESPGTDIDVAITEINGGLSGNDTIKALMEVEMKGEVRDLNGNILPNFNGVVYSTIYDKESVVITLANDAESFPFSFTVQENILYSGMSDVINGEFSFVFRVPKDIGYNYGKGKISFYVSGDNIDASGVYEELVIGGFDENGIVDNQGPEIELYFNDNSFQDGGITGTNPVLYALISDENGVNTVGSGIGHDLTAFIDDTEDMKILNQYYVADLNTYKSGIIEYPFSNITEGEHTVTLKAWDVYNNSSQKSLDFIVFENGEVAVQRLMNYPNPFIDQTSFVIEHNQIGQQLDVEINIFDISGRFAAKITRTIYSNGYKTEPIIWDGTANNGKHLRKGMYIYTLILKNENGLVAKESNKLIIIK